SSRVTKRLVRQPYVCAPSLSKPAETGPSHPGVAPRGPPHGFAWPAALRFLRSFSHQSGGRSMSKELPPSKVTLLEALHASRDEVLGIVRALPPETLESGRYENGWNGRQILAHLASIEWTYPRLIEIARDAGPEPAADDQVATRPMRGGNDAYNDRQ